MTIHVLFVFNNYRKIRLQKWNIPYGHSEKNKLCKEIISIILERPNNSCTCLKYRDFNIVYSKHGSLFFTAVTDPFDNILEIQELIYQYVFVLDKYFSHVSEVDLVFNFDKASFILDEMLIGGECQEISYKTICKAICDQDEEHDQTEPQSILTILEEISLGSISTYKKK